jgi:dUTP pyrophosphatase
MKNKKEQIEKMLKYPSFKTRGFEEITNNMMKINSTTILPTKGSINSAGYDFYSKENIEILPNNKYTFWTDVKSYMMNDEVLQIYVRSSIGIKKDLVLANGTGIIDSDYFSNLNNDGNIGICLRNESGNIQIIEKGERIAQGIFLKFQLADNIISENERIGGIGSTNKKLYF